MKRELYRWSIVSPPDNISQEDVVCLLIGRVRNHPTLADGDKCIISAVTKVEVVDDQLIVTTRTCNEYIIFEPHPTYESAFPDARERLMNVHRTKEFKKNKSFFRKWVEKYNLGTK